VLVLGVTCQPDIDDMHESPALEIIRLLEARGALISFHDPYVDSLRCEGLATPFAELTAGKLATADCVLIATSHSSYDRAWIQLYGRLIVDTRHALSPVAAKRIPVIEPTL
jgi:UDP-N-acetyl-D-glucosamine dehydrogenase